MVHCPGAVQISSSDLFWTIGITIVIISLLAALGLLKSPNQNQLTTSKEKNNVNQSGVETKAKKESEPDIKSMSASDKEIARERMSKMMSDVDLSTELDELDEIQQDEQELILEEPVIELEEDDSVQSRFAALREELSDAEGEDRGSVEDRMKKFFESDNISTTPFYTLDAIDDEIFALIVKSEKDEDWKKFAK